MLTRPPKWSKICETFPKWSMVSGGVEYLRKGINMDGFAAPNSRVFPFSEWPFQEPKSKIPYMSIYIYIQCEAPKIAKLVYNHNNYGLWY